MGFIHRLVLQFTGDIGIVKVKDHCSWWWSGGPSALVWAVPVSGLSKYTGNAVFYTGNTFLDLFFIPGNPNNTNSSQKWSKFYKPGTRYKFTLPKHNTEFPSITTFYTEKPE
jgi:hypothetical protein